MISTTVSYVDTFVIFFDTITTEWIHAYIITKPKIVSIYLISYYCSNKLCQHIEHILDTNKRGDC